MFVILWYFLQHCTLIPLQRYTKALNTFQRSALVEKSRQKPQERMNVLSKAHCLYSQIVVMFYQSKRIGIYIYIYIYLV